jgi:hypothetical protein
MQRTIFFIVIALVAVLGSVLFFALRPKPTLTPVSALENIRHSIGKEDAKVTVVDFSNYLCGHCRNHAANVFPLIKRNYVDTGKIRYVFREIAWPGQANVERAGEAAACAGENKLFETYHDSLFRSATQWASLTGESLDAYFTDLAGQVHQRHYFRPRTGRCPRGNRYTHLLRKWRKSRWGAQL